MNNELYRKLEIDPKLGLKDLLEKLGEKELEYNERAQLTDSDARREELLGIIKEIDDEIENVKNAIKAAESALIFDEEPENTEGSRKAPAAEKQDRQDKQKDSRDKDDERINKFKERAKAQTEGSVLVKPSGAQSGGTQAPPPAPAPRNPGPPPNSLQYGLMAYHQQDYVTAKSVLDPIANQGDTTAQIILAKMHLKGEGCPADPSGFVFWMKKAVAGGNDSAAGFLGEYYIINGDGSGNLFSKESKKLMTEGFDLLEKAASANDMDYMKSYVENVEIKFKSSYAPSDMAIQAIVNKKHIQKAVEYCNYLAGHISDSFEADKWQKRAENLKKGRASDGTKPPKVRKEHGCLWWLIMIFFVVPMGIMVVSFAAMIFSGEMTFSDLFGSGSRSNSTTVSQSEDAPTDTPAEPAAAPAKAFGEEPIELHNVPEERITKFENISATNESGRWYGMEDLNSAFVYKANQNNTACAEYSVEGKFELLEFRAYPYFFDNFGENASAKILIYDGENDEIISETVIDSEPVMTTVSADIKGRNKINISVSFDSGNLGDYESYLFIKDAYLYPSAKDEKIKPKIIEDQVPAALRNFGSIKIELHDVPDGAFLKSRGRNDTTDDDFTVGGEIWRSAYNYKASGGTKTAYSDYLVDGKFKRLKFKATPYTNGHFSDNTSAKIVVSDPDKDKVLYEQDVTSASGVIDASVNIKGHKRIRIAAVFVDGPWGGGDSYILVKDAYLYPADKTEEKTEGSGSAAKGVEFHELPEGSITGNKNFITEPGTHTYSPDGEDWSSAYILAGSKKSPVATASVQLGGKYKSLTLKAAALRENDHFIDKELVKFTIRGGNNSLFDERLGIDPAVKEITVDVTGLDSIDLKVVVVPVDAGYHDGYLMIKDAYLT